MDVDRLKKMASSVRTGGKGSVRRKKKSAHKTTTTDDKKLQSTLRKIGLSPVSAIEEVNIFKDDVVIQFTNPKVQATERGNSWFVSGASQTKKLEDIPPPGIMNQLGADELDNLRKLLQNQAPGGNDRSASTGSQEDDDEVPELVEGRTFEEAAEEDSRTTT